MSGMKLSLLDKRIAQFAENTTELLTGIHARNKDASKAGNKGTSNQKRKMKKIISIPNPDIDIPDEGPFGS
jgi:hypothetical protein